MGYAVLALIGLFCLGIYLIIKPKRKVLKHQNKIYSESLQKLVDLCYIDLDQKKFISLVLLAGVIGGLLSFAIFRTNYSVKENSLIGDTIVTGGYKITGSQRMRYLGELKDNFTSRDILIMQSTGDTSQLSNYILQGVKDTSLAQVISSQAMKDYSATANLSNTSIIVMSLVGFAVGLFLPIFGLLVFASFRENEIKEELRYAKINISILGAMKNISNKQIVDSIYNNTVVLRFTLKQFRYEFLSNRASAFESALYKYRYSKELEDFYLLIQDIYSNKRDTVIETLSKQSKLDEEARLRGLNSKLSARDDIAMSALLVVFMCLIMILILPMISNLSVDPSMVNQS